MAIPTAASSEAAASAMAAAKAKAVEAMLAAAAADVFYQLSYAVTVTLAVFCRLIGGFTILRHLRSYTVPKEQQQIVRILLLPIFYSAVSALGFQYQMSKPAVYFKAAVDAYESVALYAFLCLSLLTLSHDGGEQRQKAARLGKSKRLCFPFWWGRIQTRKIYYLWALKASLIQYIIMQLILAIITGATETAGKYQCASQFDPKCAFLWVNLLNGITTAAAIAGLVSLLRAGSEAYDGTGTVLKFISIKMVVGLPLMEELLLAFLYKLGVITNPLLLLAEISIVGEFTMLLIILVQAFAFNASPYQTNPSSENGAVKPLPFWRACINVVDFRDFFAEIALTCKFFYDAARGHAYTRYRQPLEDEASTSINDGYARSLKDNLDFYTAFGLEPAPPGSVIDPQRPYVASTNSSSKTVNATTTVRPTASYSTLSLENETFTNAYSSSASWKDVEKHAGRRSPTSSVTGHTVAIWQHSAASFPIFNLKRRAPEESKENWADVNTTTWDAKLGDWDAARYRIMNGRPHWYLSPIWILPQYQRLGIGRRLMNEMLERIIQSGSSDAIYLEASEQGEYLYKTLGFVIEGQSEYKEMMNGYTTAEEAAKNLAENIRGKTILITGVSPGGIGAEASRVLAKYAGLLILAGRKLEALRETQSTILEETPNANLRLLVIDLGSFQSVREAARDVNTWTEPIDVLINNAATANLPTFTTLPGTNIEAQFGTNHLGPFLFTNLIKARLAGSHNPRVVNVASGIHRLSPVLADPSFDGGKTYVPGKAYGQSKTANMLFTISLAEKWKSINATAFSLHPGIIPTNLGRNMTTSQKLRTISGALAMMFGKLITLQFMEGPIALKNIGQGAATHIVAAFDPTIVDQSGSYLDNCVIHNDRACAYAKDKPSKTYSSKDCEPTKSSKIHTVIVGGDAGLVYTPNYVDAKVGDKVIFQFEPKNHTATQSSFDEPCTRLKDKKGNVIGVSSGFEPVSNTTTVFPTFTFDVQVETPIWFYCGQVGHCPAGSAQFAEHVPVARR
ncbi:Env9p [Pseudohyphozyma bogoriensis]|nr:Env9p [Pseudohyphozyma bogoriensis]